MTDAAARRPTLLVRAGGRACALPIEHVVETMRPLPLSPLAGTPPFVLGVAVIRGEPVPVVHLGLLLGAREAPPRRFVVVRCGARRAAVAVDEVAGVAALDGVADAPPLVAAAAQGAVEALAAAGAELLVVLRAARLVPDGVWAALERGAGAA